MYTKGLLERYADTISDQELQKEFRERIGEIAFNEKGACLGVQAEEVFRNTRVKGLFYDFNVRLLEFIQDEDVQALM